MKERQERYPESVKVCHQVYITALKMNKIPTTLFCGKLPEIWQPECQVRARSHKNGTIKKLAAVVEVTKSLSPSTITAIILASAVFVAVIIAVIAYFTCQRKRSAELVMYDDPISPMK